MYDRTLKILRTPLVDQHVVADVRIHTLRPVPPVPPIPSVPRDRPQPWTAYTDEVAPIDLTDIDGTRE